MGTQGETDQYIRQSPEEVYCCDTLLDDCPLFWLVYIWSISMWNLIGKLPTLSIGVHMKCIYVTRYWKTVHCHDWCTYEVYLCEILLENCPFYRLVYLWSVSMWHIIGRRPTIFTILYICKQYRAVLLTHTYRKHKKKDTSNTIRNIYSHSNWHQLFISVCVSIQHNAKYDIKHDLYRKWQTICCLFWKDL